MGWYVCEQRHDSLQINYTTMYRRLYVQTDNDTGFPYE